MLSESSGKKYYIKILRFLTKNKIRLEPSEAEDSGLGCRSALSAELSRFADCLLNVKIFWENKINFIQITNQPSSNCAEFKCI